VSEETIRDIVSGFKAQQWRSKPLDKALRLAVEAPESLASFARASMAELPQGGTFLHAALAYLPEGDWPGLAQAAVTHLQANPENEAAAAVISYASLQCVQALHPFLTELFAVHAWFTTYYAVYPWRESGSRHVPFLEAQLRTAAGPPSGGALSRRSRDGDPRMRALHCLMETREPDALTLARTAAPSLGLAPAQIEELLHLVDYEVEDGQFRCLVPPVVRHLQFEDGYVDRLEYLSEWSFPTWETPGAEERGYRFGGVLPGSCGVCGGALHHLLTLDPIPEGLGVTGLPHLALATCLSCLGYEEGVLYFQHDPAGAPTAWPPRAGQHAPEFPSPPLQETRVAVWETSRRWQWQDWALSNSRENLNRLGGHPCWIQSAEYPSCPGCRRTMPFLMQLDSELQLEDGSSLLWGSGGIAYLFWCDGCRVSASRWQCT